MAEGSRTKSSDFRRQGIAAIRTAVNIYRVHKFYVGQIEQNFNTACDKMERALAIGKVMQDMLLEYMPAQVLAKELNRRLLEVRTSVSDKEEKDGQMSMFEEGGE